MFLKVDFDYTIKAAKLCRDVGIEHFTICSTMGADKNSWYLYPKTKGQVEENIKAMGFPRLSIFRPAFLECKRENTPPLEAAASCLISMVSLAFPKALSVPTKYVAKAM